MAQNYLSDFWVHKVWGPHTEPSIDVWGKFSRTWPPRQALWFTNLDVWCLKGMCSWDVASKATEASGCPHFFTVKKLWHQRKCLVHLEPSGTHTFYTVVNCISTGRAVRPWRIHKKRDLWCVEPGRSPADRPWSWASRWSTWRLDLSLFIVSSNGSLTGILMNIVCSYATICFFFFV